MNDIFSKYNPILKDPMRRLSSEPAIPREIEKRKGLRPTVRSASLCTFSDYQVPLEELVRKVILTE